MRYATSTKSVVNTKIATRNEDKTKANAVCVLCGLVRFARAKKAEADTIKARRMLDSDSGITN